MSTLSIPRWLLATLVAALAVSLLLIAYLVGREAGRAVAADAPGRLPGPVPARPAAGPTPPSAVPAAPAAPVEASPLSAEQEAPAIGPHPATEATPVGSEAAVEPPVPVTEERSLMPGASRPVGDYFARIDAIQVGDGGLSPEAGQAMLAAMLQGDTSGFDRLVADAERAEREAAAVVAPPECASYHRSLVGLLHDSKALLTDLRAAIASEDLDKVTAVSSRAAELQQRAQRLQDEEKELRRHHGLPSA